MCGLFLAILELCVRHEEVYMSVRRSRGASSANSLNVATKKSQHKLHATTKKLRGQRNARMRERKINDHCTPKESEKSKN